jgi:hypothetical protein
MNIKANVERSRITLNYLQDIEDVLLVIYISLMYLVFAFLSFAFILK